MIWDFIRDFFVQYIFGGLTSTGVSYGGLIGFGYVSGGTPFTDEAIIKFDGIIDSYNDEALAISLGDWLSTTATIIVMCLIVFLLICLVRWIFRAVSSAMLLK